MSGKNVANKKIPTFSSADFRIPDSLDNAFAPSTKYIECGLCPSTLSTIELNFDYNVRKQELPSAKCLAFIEIRENDINKMNHCETY